MHLAPRPGEPTGGPDVILRAPERPQAERPAEAQAMPLPLRYAVRILRLADYGDAVLLEASLPAAVARHSPSHLWHVSGGEIEPLDGGTRALWRLPDDAEPAVATCAVQSIPFDLQIGSWKLRA